MNESTSISSLRWITVTGSPHQRGEQSGVVFQNTLPEVIERYSSKWNNKELREQVIATRSLIKETLPDYFEEVIGRAHGAKVNEDIYFMLMCPELINIGSGCTSIVAINTNPTNPKRSVVIGHNEDDLFTLENSTMTKVITNKGWFYTNDFHTMPFGNGFSWNAHGIIKTVNFCEPLTPFQPSSSPCIPRYFIQRHISEATSLEDFVNRCNLPNRASGFHTFALDLNQHRAISVEVTDNDISVEEVGMNGKNFYIHTNHYIHQHILKTHNNTKTSGNSLFRFQKSTELMERLLESSKRVQTEDIRKVLEYKGSCHDESILATVKDKVVTFATILYDSALSTEVYLDIHLNPQNNRYVTKNYRTFHDGK